nr:2Fe-2S iron-sulfur cluster-binding protein [Sphingomonas sp. Mn802worker]
MGEPGERLLDACQRAGLPLEGTCGGDMACATCHVIVAAEDFARLPPASEEEEDMLDLVPASRRTSRLACQIVLTPAQEMLRLSLPAA